MFHKEDKIIKTNLCCIDSFESLYLLSHDLHIFQFHLLKCKGLAHEPNSGSWQGWDLT